MRVTSRRKRQELLGVAFDAGIRHFDVARMYGLGAAEEELGRFARTRRDQMTIATKFGIEATVPSWTARLQTPARALLSRYPALRRIVKRQDGILHHARNYDIATARASLEQSLVELRTDYVDILFVHDPLFECDIAMDQLRGFLEGERHTGRIRAWGIAGEPEPIKSLAPSLPGASVLQVRDTIFDRYSDDLDSVHPRVTFGALSSALGRIVNHVHGSDEIRRRWYEAVGADCSDPNVVSSFLLRDGLRANTDGVVLFSTSKPRRIDPSLMASVEADQDPALQAFRRLVSAELDRSL